MAACKNKNFKVIIVVSLGYISISLMSVFFTMGGVFYAEENSKLLNYAKTVCLVDHRSWKPYKCILYFMQYACYVTTWKVRQGNYTIKSAMVEGMKRHKSVASADIEAHKYQIGSSYSCWYDTRQPSVAQWDKPSIQLAIILLSCGVFFGLLTIIVFFLMYLFIRQHRHQNEQDNSIRVDFIFLK